ncbi:hypothetical protein Acr_09g0008380 [Actinidia rufa]|uniref:Uncharacterized protein n=1 Tax=Actinidia rufa TaxID=165716 RepID=A0A7J0F6P8_9ERIC|nr:hypothetical protein Acr_09g0008380 [Actinidia rufa]
MALGGDGICEVLKAGQDVEECGLGGDEGEVGGWGAEDCGAQGNIDQKPRLELTTVNLQCRNCKVIAEYFYQRTWNGNFFESDAQEAWKLVYNPADSVPCGNGMGWQHIWREANGYADKTAFEAWICGF